MNQIVEQNTLPRNVEESYKEFPDLDPIWTTSKIWSIFCAHIYLW